MTCAGTPSSTAAITVQRPSPESLTRPPNFSSFGSSASASAVRSRSQLDTTLPRRQSSATFATSMSYWYASGSRSGVVSASVATASLPMPAWRMMLKPSAYAAISAYSMPLCTIFTKCPAPAGPQCR